MWTRQSLKGIISTLFFQSSEDPCCSLAASKMTLSDFERLVDTGREINVDFMTESEAVSMLLNLAGFCHEGNEERAQHASDLIHILDCIPLAITQAASYIKKNRLSIPNYTRKLRQSDRRSREVDSTKLLSKVVQEPHSVIPQAIMMTWDCSYERLLEESPNAARIIQVLSLLSPFSIPWRMLNPEVLREVCCFGEQFELEEEIGHLSSFAMLSIPDVEISAQTTIHLAGLVSLWIRRTKISDELLLADIALRLVTNEFPLAMLSARSVGSYLVPHVRAIRTYRQSISAIENDLSRQLDYKLGRHLYYTGAYVEAEEILLSEFNSLMKLATNRELLGDCGHCVALSRAALEREDAEVWFQQVLSIRIADFGKQDLGTLQLLCDKANFLSRKGSHSQAKMVLSEVLQTRRASLKNGDDVSCVEILVRLAQVSQRMGSYVKALEFWTQALDIAEPEYGIKNMLTLQLIFGQLEVLQNLNRQDEAKNKFEDFLTKFAEEIDQDTDSLSSLQLSDKLEQVFPALQIQWKANIYDEINFMDYIGQTKMDEGRYHGAIKWYRNAHDKAERSFGEDNLVALHLRNQLAVAISQTGHFDQALTHMDIAIAGRTKKGVHRRILLLTQQDKADMHMSKGEIEVARGLYAGIHEERREVFGEDDLDTLRSLVTLADVYSDLGDHSKAIEHYQEALKGLQTQENVDIEERAAARQSLAGALTDAGDYELAITYLNQVLVDCPTNRVRRTYAELDICNALCESGKATEALKKCEEIYDNFQNWDEPPEDDMVVAAALNTRGECYHKLSEYGKALQDFERAKGLTAMLLGNGDHHELLQMYIRIGKANMKLAKQASGYQREAYYAVAEPAFSKAYHGFLTQFGEENVHTKEAMDLWVEVLDELSTPQPLAASSPPPPNRRWGLNNLGRALGFAPQDGH